MGPDLFVQGDRWSRQIAYCNPKAGSSTVSPQAGTPIDLTGWTARLQFRRDNNVAFTLTSANGGGLVIQPLDEDDEPQLGVVDCFALPAQTELLTPGAWEWELELSLTQGGVLVDRQTIYTELLQVRRQVTTP